MQPAIRREVRPMLALALPLILAEVGWMFMSIVDTVMVGHLDHPAITISAAALAQVVYNTLAFGIGGILLGLDTYLSQAHGAGRHDDANRWLFHGLALAAILTAILMSLIALAPIALLRLPIEPVILAQSVRFLRALNWGTPPLLVYLVLRRYLQAFNHVRPIAVALVTANLINALGDWLLLFPHHWRLLALTGHGVTFTGHGVTFTGHGVTFTGHGVTFTGHGVVGAAISTAVARSYLAACLLVVLWFVNRRHRYGLGATSRRFDLSRLIRLARLGAPVGGHIFVEISVFAGVTALIGTLGPLPLAGHEIALNCASITFMVPFAISAAASVRVGQAIGRREPRQAAAAGWTAIALGASCMLTSAAVMALFAHAIAHAFTSATAVIATAVPLLMVAAAFQFFDGLQITATGALRGVGNTHAGLIVHLFGYWIIGLPVGLLLCYHFKLGAVGLWLGLCIGLIIAGLALIAIWRNTTRTIERILPQK